MSGPHSTPASGSRTQAFLTLLDRGIACPPANGSAHRDRAGTWERIVSGAGNLGAPRQVPEVCSPDGELFASVREGSIVLRRRGEASPQILVPTLRVADSFWDLEAAAEAGVPTDPRMTVERFTDPWSPDGRNLIAYRRSLAGVARTPIVDWARREVSQSFQERAGGTLHSNRPQFVDVASGSLVEAALPDGPDRYIQLLQWHPGSQKAYFISYEREIRQVWIHCCERSTGQAVEVFHQKSQTPLRIQLTEVFAGAHGVLLLPGDAGFLWLDDRSGWRHIYRCTWSKDDGQPVTSGEWPVHEILDADAASVYFTASSDPARPYDIHLCKAPLSGGDTVQLTNAPGRHDPRRLADGTILDAHSAHYRPLQLDRLDAVGKFLETRERGSLEPLGIPPESLPREFTVTAADGVTDLWGILYPPLQLDEERRYPLIEYIYGGPQCTGVTRRFAAGPRRYDNLAWALSALGYAVFCVDARGTPGRSKHFQDVVQGCWSAGLADHAAAVRQLCARHRWIDGERVGVYGHSWGGYFATRALLDAPGVYHAAIAYEPGYDPQAYVFSEPYLGMPDEHPGAYAEADIFARAGELARPLLIVSGTTYARTVPSAMRMTGALIAAGIQHDFVLVPGAGHVFTGRDEEYVIDRHLRFFESHVMNRAQAREIGGGA